MLLSVIVPLYNEEEQFPLTHQKLTEQLSALPVDYEILFINDGSTDATWSLLETACQQDAHLRALSFSRNFGKEAALCAGLMEASGDAILLLDGDLQHPPEYIAEFLEAYRQGYQVIEGVKTSRGSESKFSRKMAEGFYRCFHWLTGVQLANSSDFKLLDRSVVEAWKELKERTTFFRGMVSWLGFKHKAIPFAVADRQHGASKWSFVQLLGLAGRAILSFSSKPLLLLSWVGLGFLAMAFLLGLHTLIRFLLGLSLGGFTTVILLQLLIGGLTLLGLGLIGLYLSQIYEEVKGRPRYLIDQRIGWANEEQGKE